MTDARGVDLVNGDMSIDLPLVSFGQAATALSASFEILPTRLYAQPSNFMQMPGDMLQRALRPAAYSMAADGSPDEWGPFDNIILPTGAGFVQQLSQYPRGNPGGSWSLHTNPDGSRYGHSMGTTHVMRFESNDPNLVGVYNANGDRGIADAQPLWGDLFDRFILANGEEWRFHRQTVTVPCTVNCQGPTQMLRRLRFLTSSRGYGIQFVYVSDTTPANNANSGSWLAPRRVTGYNRASVYCNESLLQECAALTALPSAEITYSSTAGTALIKPPGSSDGTELTFSMAAVNPPSIRQTAVPNSTVSFQLATDNGGSAYISRITDPDGQWNYTHTTYVDDSGHTPLMAAGSTNPDGNGVSISGYGTFGTIQTYTNELGSSYYYSDGFPFRDNGRTEPEGDDTQVERDERNNITTITRHPKPNTGLSPITMYTAAYPVHCMNPRTCNKPSAVTDGNGNTTDYTYAPEHGGVLTETGPLVPTRQNDGSMANVRPQKRYEYAQRTAWTSNGAGGYVAGAPMWLLVRERQCRTTAALDATCAGGADDEVVTDYDYGPNSGPNTLLLRGVAVTANDGTQIVTRRTCYGYDLNGNRISETQPSANLVSCS